MRAQHPPQTVSRAISSPPTSGKDTCAALSLRSYVASREHHVYSPSNSRTAECTAILCVPLQPLSPHAAQMPSVASYVLPPAPANKLFHSLHWFWASAKPALLISGLPCPLAEIKHNMTARHLGQSVSQYAVTYFLPQPLPKPHTLLPTRFGVVLCSV